MNDCGRLYGSNGPSLLQRRLSTSRESTRPPSPLLSLTRLCSMMPVYARPPFMNLFAIGWSTYLASVNIANAGEPIGAKGGLGSESIAVIAAEVME